MVQPEKACQGIFSPCRKYLEIFNNVALVSHVPAMVLMSLAMQESHCDASLKGPNGEIGIMQVIKDNCKGDCWQVKENISAGAMLFKSYLDQANGNALEALGQYNGWTRGMNKQQATDKKYGCYSQRNLDYLNSMCNGWLQGKDGDGDEFKIYNK